MARFVTGLGAQGQQVVLVTSGGIKVPLEVYRPFCDVLPGVVVSDFYVPVSEMPEHKIQSSGGPLQRTVKMVPKILSPLIEDCALKAFIISFKLETDPSIVINRAQKALEVYQHRVVVANILES